LPLWNWSGVPGNREGGRRRKKKNLPGGVHQRKKKKGAGGRHIRFGRGKSWRLYLAEKWGKRFAVPMGKEHVFAPQGREGKGCCKPHFSQRV